MEKVINGSKLQLALADYLATNAYVCAEDDGMYQERIYHARVKVVDMGQLNPFVERRVENGKCTN